MLYVTERKITGDKFFVMDFHVNGHFQVDFRFWKQLIYVVD